MKTIIGIGEILWDIFPERKILGGAPANFAYHASQFGFGGYVVSAIGKDSLGKEILDVLAEKKLNFLIETVDYPTGTVQVTLDTQGIPKYEICENAAWDNIPFTKRTEELALNCNAVCFGTLAQRNETSRKTVYRFLEHVPKNAYKIFDINLRQHFYNKKIIHESLLRCNILKINDEEATEIARLFGFAGVGEQEICLRLLKKYNLDIVVETKGAAGSYVFTAGEISYLDTPKVRVADTVGAGDSFTGAFVAALLQGKTIRKAHQLAVETSAYVCTQHGAMPHATQPHSFKPIIDLSKALFERAVRVMPGGVNSPVRAFKAVGGTPLFINRAEGSRIYDADGNEYIDYVSSWGPLILGHNNAVIREAVTKAAQKGMSFGAPTEAEVKLAEKIRTFAPGVEMVRMVNSGTEAVMSALRLARAYTGRQKLIKFEGCYHGHSDSMLVEGDDTLIALYNDLTGVEELLKKNKAACVIVEPVAANMGVVLPKEGFLSGLKELCGAYGTLLIFDEVITGFRLGKGGAQEYYGVRADLVTYGKIIGGGMPVGAYGGRKEIMELVAPSGPVYQAGTFSGNPIAMTAGLAQLETLENQDVYSHINRMGEKLACGLSAIVQNSGLKACVNRIGSFSCLFFGIESADDYRSAKKADTELYARYFHGMLGESVYFAPSQFEATFVSCAHTENDIDETLYKAERVINSLNLLHYS